MALIDADLCISASVCQQTYNGEDYIKARCKKKNGQYLSLAIFCPKTFLQMSRPKMQSGSAATSGQDQM